MIALLGLTVPLAAADSGTRPDISIKRGSDGHLVYAADAAGNRVIDFSSAGYRGGGVAIPAVPVKIVVAPEGPRDGARIQAALDLVAALPRDTHGWRGAVLLLPGRFVIGGNLHLGASGVVLRGSGDGENGTVLVAAGTGRRTLIEIGGRGGRSEMAATRVEIGADLVPVGAQRIPVAEAKNFAPGDRVVVRRPCTAEWIAHLGMNTMPGWRTENRIQWAPRSRELAWDRTVIAVETDAVRLDAPITTALERRFGGGTVAKYEFAGRIDEVGVENLRLVSEFDAANPQDEEHAWMGISLDSVEHAWVRRVTGEHLVSSLVYAQSESRAVTIEDCAALAPVSERAAYRRLAFVAGGQQILVQRCRSEHGLHDFTTGFAAAGLNVFLHCTANDALDWSGPAESWASGLLYDNVIILGNALRFLNRGAAAQGSGWTAANSILWNCQSTELQVQSAPGALNQAYGCKGLIVDDALVYDPRRAPYREFVRGSAVEPASLYEAQLTERLGGEAARALEAAAIGTNPDGARRLSAADLPAAKISARPHPLGVAHGQFVIDGERAWTATMNYSWYLGQMPRPLARGFGHAITRFAPGETGTGLTDDLEVVVGALAPRGVYVQHYGLWYDRRRINHNFYGSPELPPDDVTPPFMEMPWARSGEGRDWNGLSKYDLTKFNPWYFARVKAFADLCDARGRILYFNFYFQHALQETRAHYVDFPWRPVNCLQDTGLPDENPAANSFYDVADPLRRDLHRRYLRHCLDVLGDNTNVVYGIDREYSGPLSFVQFWLDTIAEWEREHGRKVFVALEVPKAEMDAILADPTRGPMITAIDFHHWFYRPDGSLFAIVGGINRAPREQSVNILPEADVAALRARSTYPGDIVNAPEFLRAAQTARAGTPILRYRALREYRDAFPEVVVLRRGDEFPAVSAAIEKAIPATERARTRPAALLRNAPTTSWAMAAPGRAYLVYTMDGKRVDLDLTGDSGRFALSWLNAETGELRRAPDLLAAGRVVTLDPKSDGPAVAWLSRP